MTLVVEREEGRYFVSYWGTPFPWVMLDAPRSIRQAQPQRDMERVM